PMTPREERGYGDTSISSARGRIWRISPNPLLMPNEISSSGKTGLKNFIATKPASSLTVSRLDTRNLSPITPEGETLETFTIDGVEVERIRLADTTSHYLQPGIRRL
ncbi:MAG: hypothetical protein M3P33_01825, partial [bacterium]|nr:hypothetical protein [bacterium]